MNNTNINEVVVDILTGVKVAGKEIYGASKETVVSLVSLIKEQSPELFNQFIAWKLYESILYFLLFSIPMGVFFYASYVLHKADKELSSTDAVIGKWIAMIVGFVILMFNLGINGMDIVKISCAPKIYMIEYIVKSMKH